MRKVDRVLLYFVSVTLAVILIRGERQSPQSASLSPDPWFRQESVFPTGESRYAPIDAGSADRRSSVADRSENLQAQEKLELLDSQGRTRLELFVDSNDEPQLLMRGPDGSVVLRIAAGDAASSIELGQDGAGQISVSGGADVDQVIELSGREGAGARLELSHANSAALRLAGRASGDELLVRADADGTAEIGFQSGRHDGSVALQLQSSGVASFVMTGPDGRTGPFLNVFDDGLAEIAISGGTNSSGPSLIRMPDGLSIISARRPNGEPGASMVVAPNGQAVVAATSSGGTQQAELRVDEEGVPSVSITDPDELPEPIPQPSRPPNDTVLLSPTKHVNPDSSS